VSFLIEVGGPAEAAGEAGSRALLAYRGEWAGEGLRGAIDEVAKKQRHERGKVSELREAMGEVQCQMNQTEEAVEWLALGLAETTDRTSRVESDAAGLREAMADGSAKVEAVQREVAGQKAQVSDCPKLNQDLTELERQLAKLKEEIRELQLQKGQWRTSDCGTSKQFAI
jgi:chromosome segregation ATPase